MVGTVSVDRRAVGESVGIPSEDEEEDESNWCCFAVSSLECLLGESGMGDTLCTPVVLGDLFGERAGD